jgi:hypothetical protein
LERWRQESSSSRPTQEKVSYILTQKQNANKRAQVVEHLPSMLEALGSISDIRNLSQAWWQYACFPSTHEAEAGGSQVKGQRGLHMEKPCLKTKKRKETEFLIIYILNHNSLIHVPSPPFFFFSTGA